MGEEEVKTETKEEAKEEEVNGDAGSGKDEPAEADAKAKDVKEEENEEKKESKAEKEEKDEDEDDKDDKDDDKDRKKRKRHRERSRDRKRDRDSSRDKKKDRDRSRERKKDRDSSRDRKKDKRDRDGSRERGRDSSRDRRRDRDGSRERKRDRSRDRKRDSRERRRDRSRDRRRRKDSRSRSRDRRRSRSRDRRRSRSGGRRYRSPSSPRRGKRSKSVSLSASESEDKGRKIFSSEGLFLGYANEMGKSAEDRAKEVEEKQNNAKLLAQAVMAPQGGGGGPSPLGAGMPPPGGYQLGGNTAQSHAVLGQSLVGASQLQKQLEADKKLRRIHVGNLPEKGTRERKIKEFFETQMKAKGLAVGEPVKDVYYNANGRFAFVELCTPDEATRCIQELDGAEFEHCKLKISRPPDYALGTIPGMTPTVPVASPPVAMMASQQFANATMQMAQLQQLQQIQIMQATQQMQLVRAGLFNAGAAAAVPAAVPVAAVKEPLTHDAAMAMSLRARRVRVGNMPSDPELAAGLKEFLNALLPALKLSVRDGECVIVTTPDATDGALVELRTVREAQNARQNLGGLKYGDNTLTVDWPADYAPLTDDEVRQLMGSGVLGIDGDGSSQTVTGPKEETMAAAVIAAGAGTQPRDADATKVVVIANLLSAAELADEKEAVECMEDTRDKCEEDFGEVSEALIATPGSLPEGPEYEEWMGKMMVLFKEKDSAMKAAKALHGLKFDGRPARCTYASEEMFRKLHDWMTKKIHPKDNKGTAADPA